MDTIAQGALPEPCFKPTLLSDMTYCIGLLCEKIGKNTHDRALPDLDIHRYRHARLQKDFSAVEPQILTVKLYLDRKMIDI